MRSILEQAFVELLNENHDKAEELFHKFIVERARQIHESNRAGEDYVLDENWNDEITTESYFTEEDLADLEDDGDDVDGVDDSFGEVNDDEEALGDLEAGEGEIEDAEGDLEATEDDLDGEETRSEEERIESLEDQMEKLVAEFEAMMDTIGGDLDSDEETNDLDGSEDDLVDFDDEVDDEVSDEVDDTDMADDVADDMDDEEEVKDDYDDITESIIDELEKVSVTLDDGEEIGVGPKVTQYRGASIPQKSKEARQGGSPIKMKQSTHTSFARETPPTSTEVNIKARNNKTPKVSGLDKISKEGDKSAEVNKPTGDVASKSPISGK